MTPPRAHVRARLNAGFPRISRVQFFRGPIPAGRARERLPSVVEVEGMLMRERFYLALIAALVLLVVVMGIQLIPTWFNG
jgi:hypothetical protein